MSGITNVEVRAEKAKITIIATTRLESADPVVIEFVGVAIS